MRLYWKWLLRTLFISLITTVVNAELVQVPVQYNMDFEVMDGDSQIPIGWTFEGLDYSGCTDSLEGYSGVRSFRVSYIGMEPVEDYGYISRYIPFTYEENTITLSGWFRTGDVSDNCKIGLYLYLYDKYGKLESRKNMYLENLPGSAEWRQLEVSIENSSFGCELELGMFLYGTGTVWIDDLELLLDGKPLSEASPRILPNAELDHEFDTGSGLEFTEVNDFQLESLDLLGKVWVFLKYHHPQIGRGDINWDYSLFRVLPSVLDADTEDERQQALLGLIENLDPVSVHECSIPLPDEIRLSLDLDWISGPEVSPELAAALLNIYDGRFQEEHYYVRGTPFSYFSECEYGDMALPDTGFRLLALYRYWGIIEYYFPYLYAIDGNWDDVLRAYIPVFIAADSPLSYQLALQILIVAICDSHAIIVDETDVLREFYGNLCIPLRLVYIEDQWIVDGYTHESAFSSGIEFGDVIIAIDGRPVRERTEQLFPYTTGSTAASRFERLGRNLLRGNTETVSLTIQRGDNTQVVTVQRVEWEEVNTDLAETPALSESTYTIMDDGTAYVYAALLRWNELDAMKEDLREVDRLILDLRDYPGGFVIYDMADFIILEETVFAYFTYPDYLNPGTFIWKEPCSAGGGDSLAFEGRIAILIDEGAQSLAEFTAMAWRLAPQARVFGSPSAGADGNVVFVPLPGGIRTRFSGIGVYNPDKSETQRVGIQPDVVVRPTIEGMQHGRDEVLEAALEWLSSEDS